MNKARKTKRRQIFIKKRFQTDFALRFLILIAVESVLAIGLFVYLSRGTIVTGYSGSEVVVARTGDYFLPTLVIANLLIIGLTAAAGFVVLLYTSHKIAGPLYRFEKALDEIAGGDLTYRFNLRHRDQLDSLARSINELNTVMEDKLRAVQARSKELADVLRRLESGLSAGNRAEVEGLLKEAMEKAWDLDRSANYFRTSFNAQRDD